MQRLFLIRSSPKSSPDVTKIIKIDTTQNIDLDAKRSIIYEAERRGVPPTTGDVFGFYYKTDYTGKFKHSRNGEEGNRNYNQLGAGRGRSEITANPVIKSEVNEDEGTVTVTYKDGGHESKKARTEAKEANIDNIIGERDEYYKATLGLDIFCAKWYTN